MKELVSVIIPFYNEEQYIGDCLISLIKQTYKNIEIICVDDGSTDNGAMIVKAIQQSDSRISLIQQENMNAGTARNVGFSKAKGEYVLFLDSDDFFSPSMVERMLNKALSTNSDIVFCTGYGLNVITKETYMMPPVGKDNASFPNKEVFSSADTTDGIFQLSVTWAWDKMSICTIPQEYRNFSYNIGIPKWKMSIFVFIPAIFPYLLSGVRNSWGRAWRSLISAEAIFYISGSQQGLGYWIYSNRAYANMCDVMVGVLMIVLISIAVEKMFQIIENRTIKKWGVTK